MTGLCFDQLMAVAQSYQSECMQGYISHIHKEKFCYALMKSIQLF